MSIIKNFVLVILLSGTAFVFINKKNQSPKSEVEIIDSPSDANEQKLNTGKAEVSNESDEIKKQSMQNKKPPFQVQENEKFSEDPRFPKDQLEKKEVTDPQLVKHNFEQTIAFALELLERKKSEDILEEFQRLKPVISEANSGSRMLIGNFRDTINNTELRLAFWNQSDTQIPCFYSKEVGRFNNENGMSVHADEKGYAVFKISSKYYARIMWSFEKERVIHGYIYKKMGTSWSLLRIFYAKELRLDQGEFLDKCFKTK